MSWWLHLVFKQLRLSVLASALHRLSVWVCAADSLLNPSDLSSQLPHTAVWISTLRRSLLDVDDHTLCKRPAAHSSHWRWRVPFWDGSKPPEVTTFYRNRTDLLCKKMEEVASPGIWTPDILNLFHVSIFFGQKKKGIKEATFGKNQDYCIFFNQYTAF